LHPIDWPEPGEPPAYVRLGDQELVVALPAAHRLASLDRVPREALLDETFVDWPEGFWPQLAAHARVQLFGTADHPDRIEVLEALEDSVPEVLASRGGFAAYAIAANGPTPIPPSGIVYRRVEEPVPLLEYGLVWLEPNASSATATFVELLDAPEPSVP
jgi:DNA-binding transcriptional LysR family regulator